MLQTETNILIIQLENSSLYQSGVSVSQALGLLWKSKHLESARNASPCIPGRKDTDAMYIPEDHATIQDRVNKITYIPQA